MPQDYYDPAKAHEYYMKNRQLKGKHSMKGMTQQQKEQWTFARDSLKSNAKNDKAVVNRNTKNEIDKRANALKLLRDKIKKEREIFRNQAQDKIKQIQLRMKNMTPEQRKAVKEMFKEQIDMIRSDRRQMGDILTNESKNATAKKVADSKALRNKRKEIRADITNKTNKAIDDAYKHIRG